LHTRSLQPEKPSVARWTSWRALSASPPASWPRRAHGEVSIRVGTATIGIRGTDVWGKTDKDGDLVALLEGRIDITRAGQVTEMAARP
jgi:hypothetical protein